MRILRFVLLAVTACMLSACFDLDQKVSVNRDGSGRYVVAITAEGPFGDAIKSDRGGKNDMLAPNKAATTTTVSKNGKTTKTASVDFHALSELTLKDERVSLKVLDAGLLGLTPKLVRFRRSFHVGDARAARSGGAKDDEEMGQAMLSGFFGNHEYSFSVTLPGSIVHIAPVKIGRVEIKPEISGDYWHHTVVWRMPLTRMMMAKDLVFEADFSAVGSFANSQTR